LRFAVKEFELSATGQNATIADVMKSLHEESECGCQSITTPLEGNKLPNDEPTSDPDLPPEHEVNREAAGRHKLLYDFEKEAYVDDDGCLIGIIGQPL
jgi:hypothetical protein